MTPLNPEPLRRAIDDYVDAMVRVGLDGARVQRTDLTAVDIEERRLQLVERWDSYRLWRDVDGTLWFELDDFLLELRERADDMVALLIEGAR